MNTVIGIDLGCTNIKAVLTEETGKILYESRAETREQDDKHWKEVIRCTIDDFKKRSPGKVVAVGLCAPGLADAENSCITCMPGRLPGLEHFDWSAHTGERIHVLNDAHAALTAEAMFGAGKGYGNLIMITLGSGVGGGILIGGKLHQGRNQMAGHIGHTTVNADTHHCDVTMMPGSIEEAIGNITIGQRSHGKYDTTFALIEAYRRGELFATWLWLDSVRKLAVSIASTINVVAPDAVIVGGGIAQAGEALMKPLDEFLALYEWRPAGTKTPLIAAHFSDMAGAMGAAAFALSQTQSP